MIPHFQAGQIGIWQVGAAAAAHRYWRLLITAGDTHMYVRNVTMREEIGGANVTTGGTASASVTGGGSAAWAFDDNDSTYWYAPSAGNLPAWLKYDFGAGNDKAIVEFSVHSYSATEMILAYELQYSDDDSAWTTTLSCADTEWANNQIRVYSESNA